MSKLFIVNGKGKSGKDTFETMVADIAFKDDKSTCIGSTIDLIKELAKGFGYKGEKTPKDRKMLCELKRIMTEYNDSPYSYISQVIWHEQQTADIIFIDCREPMEIARFVKDFNAITVLVKRDITEFYGNTADDNVDNYKNYDIIIDNDGSLEDLRQKAIKFYKKYCG